jgi:hypothetical protein
MTTVPPFFIPHDPSQGFTGEWTQGGKIGLFTFTSMTQTSLDAWKRIFEAWRKSLPPAEPAYILFDVTSLYTISPQVWVGSLWIAYSIQHLPGATAFVVSDSPIAHLAGLLVKQLSLRPSKRQRKLFRDRQMAIDWLEACLAESSV